MQTRFNFSTAVDPADAHVWAPRAGNDTHNVKFVWDNVLRMLGPNETRAVDLTRMQYGTGFLCDPSDAACMGQLVSVPAAVLASGQAGAGLGMFAKLDDAIFGLNLDVQPSAVTFTRNFNRLAGSHGPVEATYYLVPLAGVCWRPLFAWGRAAFPRFFLSPTLLAGSPSATFTASRETSITLQQQQQSMAKESLSTAHRNATTSGAVDAPPAPPAVVSTGLGLYSCANVADMNLTEVIDLSGANINWDAHFYWPYIGMYLPPLVPADAQWTTNQGSGEELHCGPHYVHGQRINTAAIHAEYVAAKRSGITTLAYFNLNEYGQDFSCTPVPPIANTTNDWANSTQFLADHMPDAVLPGCPGTVRSVSRVFSLLCTLNQELTKNPKFIGLNLNRVGKTA